MGGLEPPRPPPPPPPGYATVYGCSNSMSSASIEAEFDAVEAVSDSAIYDLSRKL